MSKKLKGITLWDFSTFILLQNSKKIEGGRLVEKTLKKSSTVPKNIYKGGLVRYCLLRGSVFWANRYNLASSQNFIELLVELFWSLLVVLKNTDEKP